MNGNQKLPMPTSQSTLSSAEICRQNGWGPETILVAVGCERPSGHVLHLKLTAIGVKQVLGFLIMVNGVDVEYPSADESIWDLRARDWRTV